MVTKKIECSRAYTFQTVNLCLKTNNLFYMSSTCEVKRLNKSGIAFKSVSEVKNFNSVLLTCLSNVPPVIYVSISPYLHQHEIFPNVKLWKIFGLKLIISLKKMYSYIYK